MADKRNILFGVIGLLVAIEQKLLGIVMPDKRTIKVLCALLVAMTGGAFLLMSMESAPPATMNPSMASITGKVAQYNQTLNHTWRRIVIHSAPSQKNDLPGRCHFIIDQQADKSGQGVATTELWQRQVRGFHVMVAGHDFDSDSIGICLIGNFDVKSPSSQQFAALTTLVRELQKRYGISADSVYLNCELDASTTQPGKAFPAELFNASLVR